MNHDSGDTHHPPADEGTTEDRLNAEGEVALARLALDGGNLQHAANHLAGALGCDPSLPEAYESLAALTAAAGGPRPALDLFTLDDPFIGTIAARVALLAQLREWSDALGLLGAMIAHDPALPWALAAGLDCPQNADTVDPALVTPLLAHLARALPDPAPPPVATALRPVGTLVRSAVARGPADAALLTMASAIGRRLGRTEDAIDWARRAQAAGGGRYAAVMLGYALRTADRIPEALAVWEEEAQREPVDASLCVDIAELHSHTGDLAQAVAWLERAVAAEPGHHVAVPELAGMRFAVDGDTAHLVWIADLVREHPEYSYGASVLEEQSTERPWLDRVPVSSDSVTDLVHQVLEKRDDLSDGRMLMSALEPPSAVAVAQRAFPGLQVDAAEIGSPDPREPVPGRDRPLGHRLWEYDGTTATPLLGPPDPEVSETLRTLATVKWASIPALYEHAQPLESAPVPDLLGALVHPPSPRADSHGEHLRRYVPDLWVRAVQTMACLGIARHDTAEPWIGSRRREVLTDLLDGVEDWVTETAAFALVAAAWADPALREDVGDVLVRRMVAALDARRTRGVPVLTSLATLVQCAPWVPAEFGGLARKIVESKVF